MIHIEKILYPTDFSENSLHALEYAGAFAKHFGAELHLIHVISDLTVATLPPSVGYLPDGYYEEIKRRADDELEKLPGKELSDQIKVVRKSLEGNTFTEISHYAKANNIDLIVMGTHGYTGFTHLLMGSIAEKVVRIAPCPVLTVHPEDHEFVMP